MALLSAASPAFPRGHAAPGAWLRRPSLRRSLFRSPTSVFIPETPLFQLPFLPFLLLEDPPGGRRSRDPFPVPWSREARPVSRSRDPRAVSQAGGPGGDVPQTGGQGPARCRRQEGPAAPASPRRTGPGPRFRRQRRPRRAAPGSRPQAAGGAGRWVSAATGVPGNPGAGDSPGIQP